MSKMLPDLPESLHSAFIEIDTSSDGGQMWVYNDLPMRLTFAFFASEDFTEEVSANYSQHDVIGRSEEYLVYNNTTNRSFPLSLTFFAQGGKGLGLKESLKTEVGEKVDWCRALHYPTYFGGRAYPPPVLNVHLGNLYVRTGAAIRCISESVSVTYNGPIDVDTHATFSATVDLQFKAVASSSDALPHAPSVLRGRN